MSEHKKGIIALILLAWVFASMGIFARYLGTSFEIFEQTYLRIAVAFFLGVIVFWGDLNWRKLRGLPKKDLFILIFRSISLYLGVVFISEALLNTKYGNASFMAVLPLLPIFGYFFLREKLKFQTILYIILGFLGAAFIAISDFSSLTFGYGEVMAFLSLIAFDLSYVARKWHSEYLNNKETTILMFAIGAVFLFVSSIFMGEPVPRLEQFTPIILITLLGAGVFNVANLFLTNYGFQKIKVGVAGNVLMLEAVFGLLYSVFLYGETPLVRELIGGALILFSIYQVNRLES